MNKKLTTREMVLWSCCLLLAGILFLGGDRLPEVSARERGDLYEELKIFTDVLAIVRRDYVEEIDSRKAIEGAIKGMLSTLDPHSGYFDPEFYKDLRVQTKGEFGGLGIEITVQDGMLMVVAPMEGSPAARAGVLSGDAIVKIDGKYTKDFTLIDAVKRLRGPKGSPITISIHRKGTPELIDVTIVRDKITVKSVKHRYLGDGLGYVRISQFMERTAEDLKKALKKMKEADESRNLKGLVLDLRNNPGGLLDQAILVCDMFLKEGVVVYTRGRDKNQEQKFFAHSLGTEPEFPIIVLVNGGSASASEIVAGALKDHGRALIVGKQTFGKGSVQTITPLKNGGAVTITTALYYTKSGNSIQARGVAPDIDVDPAITTIAGGQEQNKTNGKVQQIREKDLPGALSNPMGVVPQPDVIEEDAVSISPTAVDIETVELKKWAELDPQFSRAYDLLKTFDLFKG